MIYLLLPYYDETAWFKMTKEEQEQGSAAYGEYSKALTESGVLVESYRPHPTTAAKTVRVINGNRDVQKRPYVDSNEQVGGIYVIDVPDLDSALLWAERNPAAAYGAVEVRGVWD